MKISIYWMRPHQPVTSLGLLRPVAQLYGQVLQSERHVNRTLGGEEFLGDP